MKKAVLIAEKPSLMREIESVYRKNKNKIPYEIEFTCFVGHIYKLAPPSEYDDFEGSWDIERLPIIPSWNNFKITLDPTKKELLTKINKSIREFKPDIIINACDPDREGEHIFRLYKDTNLQSFKGEIKRFWCNDLTEKEILDKLINLTEEKINLREAAFCRAKSDWLIGMNFTEAATVMFSRGKNSTIKIGRVKTPLLNIVYQRELEIQNFKPSSKYQIKAKYKDGFEGTLFDENGNIEFQTIEECENYIKNIGTEAHLVKEFIKKTISSKAPQLYKLSDIQIEAGKKYGYTASQVLEIMQSLYEKKYTSYPRTDSRFISTEAAKDIPIMLKHIKTAFPDLSKYINEIENTNVVSIAQKNNKLCNDTEVSKSGHTALITTTMNLDLNKLTIEETNLLKMVCIRLISHFMQPLKENKIEIITQKDNHLFKSTYKTLIDKGYSVLLDKNTNYVTLKDVKQGNKINASEIISHEVKATCPSRFTSAELVYAMENPSKYLYNKNDLNKNIINKINGIGTQATRGEIINSLIKDGYCTMTGKNNVFVVTEFGMKVMNILNEASFAKVDLTAVWEQYLEKIERGNLTSDQYKRLIEDYVKEGVKLIEKIQGATISNVSSLKEKCPECGSDILIGKNYYYCAKYKKDIGCPFIIPQKILTTKITEKDASNLINGKIIEKKLTKDAKSWNQKIRLNGNKLEFAKPKVEKVGECPCCGGDVIKNSWGYGCKEYKSGCKFGISENIAGKKITKKMVQELLEYGETSREINGFIGKKGNEFSAKLIINDEGKVNFKFNQE